MPRQAEARGEPEIPGLAGGPDIKEAKPPREPKRRGAVPPDFGDPLPVGDDLVRRRAFELCRHRPQNIDAQARKGRGEVVGDVELVLDHQDAPAAGIAQTRSPAGGDLAGGGQLRRCSGMCHRQL